MRANPAIVMKFKPRLALLLAIATMLVAGDSPNSRTQVGKLSTTSLLATQRISGKGAPDGMRFLFFVARTPGIAGQFTLKETRDFLVSGQSYQGRTQTELGKTIEPETVFDSAEGFFAKQPGARSLAPADINGAYVLTIAIAGTKIPSGSPGEITVNVGFEKAVEPFTFRFSAPPERPGGPKS